MGSVKVTDATTVKNFGTNDWQKNIKETAISHLSIRFCPTRRLSTIGQALADCQLNTDMRLVFHEVKFNNRMRSSATLVVTFDKYHAC